MVGSHRSRLTIAFMVAVLLTVPLLEASPAANAAIEVVPGSIVFRPVSPSVGQDVNISFRVANTGTTDVEASARIEVTMDGVLHDTLTIPPFGVPAESEVETSAWWRAEAGAYEFNVIAGSPNMTDSSSASAALTVAADGPAVYVEQDSIAYSSLRPQPDDAVDIFARVRNDGDSTVEVDASITVSPADRAGHEIITMDPFVMQPHSSHLINATWIAGAVGEYDVAARAAPRGTTTLSEISPADEAKLHVGGSSSGQLLLTAGLLNVGNVAYGEERTIPVDVTAYNRPFSNVSLRLLESSGLMVQVLTPNSEIEQGQTVKFFLRVTAPSAGNDTSTMGRVIRIQATSDDTASNVESINVVMHRADVNNISFTGLAATAGALAVGGALAATFRRRA